VLRRVAGPTLCAPEAEYDADEVEATGDSPPVDYPPLSEAARRAMFAFPAALLPAAQAPGPPRSISGPVRYAASDISLAEIEASTSEWVGVWRDASGRCIPYARRSIPRGQVWTTDLFSVDAVLQLGCAACSSCS
jgi:hypothetical protein